MKRTDLKSGMVVKFINWDKLCILIDNVFCEVDGSGFMQLNGYDENMHNTRVGKEWDIVEVYKCKYPNIMSCFIKNELELIWERKEIDWSKVPFGTMVRVWDSGEESYEGKFLGYNEEEEGYYPFNVFVDVKYDVAWEKCELIEEPKEEKELTYEEILKASEEYCDKNISTVGCGNCKHSKESFCEFSWILDNFKIIRK